MNNKLLILKKKIGDFFRHWYYYSFPYAFWGLTWWFCFYCRVPYSWNITSYALRRKTAFLDQHIQHRYGDIIERYKQVHPTIDQTTEQTSRVWVFWGQGEENMPPLIHACYRQLTHFNHNVTLVTNQNVDDYISLSPVIMDKVLSGRITWAHYSDIVRNTLLAQYGGLWLDATVWVSGKLPFDKLNEMQIFSANGPVPISSRSVCFWTSLEWNWSGWCIWAKKSHHPLYSFVSEMLQEMAVKEFFLLDYVLIDYLIYYACRFFPQVKQDMEARTIHNLRRNDFAGMMNQPFDEGQYKKLIQNDFVFKLSFRSQWSRITPNGKMTYYGRIISEIINPFHS